MTRRDDPRLFYGPPAPFGERPVSQPDVVFAAEEQPRGAHTQRRYQGEALTPAYRRHVLNNSPLGRQILKDEDEAQSRDDQGRYQSHATGAPSPTADGKGVQAVTNEYQRQGLVYKELYRQILKDEAAAQAGR